MKPCLGSLLTVAQVAQRLGVTSVTVTRWCESGKLPAIAKPYGKKTTYQISPQAVELLVNAQTQEQSAAQKPLKLSHKSHEELIPHWKTAMAAGLINGRAFSKATMDDYSFYVTAFFKRHKEVSLSTLKAELARIPNHQIAKRQHCFKAIVCLGKVLIAKNCLDAGVLDAVKPLYPKRHLPPKRSTLSIEELEKLFQTCQTLDERFILALLAYTGLRASEACALTWEDLNLEARAIHVRLGKGGNQRQVGISAGLMEAIHRYRASLPPTSPNQYVLLNRHGRQMTRSGLYQRLERLGVRAGVKTVSPHALRRAFVTMNASKGRSLVMLQMACGHSKTTTTRSYCLTSEQEAI